LKYRRRAVADACAALFQEPLAVGRHRALGNNFPAECILAGPTPVDLTRFSAFHPLARCSDRTD
jgi:hypothetical protein